MQSTVLPYNIELMFYYYLIINNKGILISWLLIILCSELHIVMLEINLHQIEA